MKIVFPKIYRLNITIAAAIVLFSHVISAVPLAEYVMYKAKDGQGLNALLYSPKSSTRSLVIMIPGGTGGYLGGGHDYTPLAEKLNNNGYALLIANMRTAGLHGWLSARFEDTEQDVGAAFEFAKSRGLNNIVLFGTSLGGPRVMYYWSQTKDPNIKAMGFLAAITSPYLAAKHRFDKKKHADLDVFLQKARELVKAGKGGDIIAFPNWSLGRSFPLTAESYLSYFGNLKDSNASTVKFGDQVTLPTVVIHGEKDVLALPQVAEEIYASLTSAPKRDLIIIKGAGHYLSPGPIAERYSQAVIEWVMDIAPPVR